MPLPPPPTLGEIRDKVGIRVGLNTSGKLGARIQATITEAVNRAQQLLVVRASWARNLIEAEFPLVEGQREYDIPDDCDRVGGIQRLEIKDVDGRRLLVPYDDRQGLTANTVYAETASQPRTWQIVNDVILLTPAPSVTYPTWVVRYLPAPLQLVNDADRVIVDREAVIALSTLIVKRYLGVAGDLTQEQREFEMYLRDLRSAKTGPGRMYSIASGRLMGPAYWEYPSVDAAVFPWTVDWNPGNGAGW